MSIMYKFNMFAHVNKDRTCNINVKQHSICNPNIFVKKRHHVHVLDYIGNAWRNCRMRGHTFAVCWWMKWQQGGGMGREDEQKHCIHCS